MPLLAILTLLLQVLFAVHAVKTGREYWWIYIIIIFPLVGCLVYFFAEVLPELRYDPLARKALSEFLKITDPKRELRYLKEQVEISNSIKNRKALAEAYVNLGSFDEAISLYQTCLEGIYEDDPAIWEGLTCAYFFKGDFEQAKKSFIRLKEIQKNKLSYEFRLLWARLLEESKDTDNALKEYESLLKEFRGEEARCRYALLLKNTGNVLRAKEIFNEIIKNVKLSPGYYRKTQKKWIDIAKKEI